MGQQNSADMQEQGPTNPETVWWCRLLARAIGVIAGILCLICAVFTLITFSPWCIVSAILMFLVGAVVLVFEAPICCSFIEMTKPVGAWAEQRTYFQKAFLYVIMAIIPFAMCWGLSTLFGCGPVFAAGVFYGLMALGKKADREQMMQNAHGLESGQGGMKSESMDADLVANEAKTPNDNPFGQYK